MAAVIEVVEITNQMSEFRKGLRTVMVQFEALGSTSEDFREKTVGATSHEILSNERTVRGILFVGAWR
jgi:hypothetical protein